MTKSTHTLGDGPVQAQYKAEMTAIVQTLDDVLNPGVHGPDRQTGFVLMVFPFGDDHAQRCNFMSNGADRKDLAVLFREMAARFEGQAEVSGTA